MSILIIIIHKQHNLQQRQLFTSNETLNFKSQMYPKLASGSFHFIVPLQSHAFVTISQTLFPVWVCELL